MYASKCKHKVSLIVFCTVTYFKNPVGVRPGQVHERLRTLRQVKMRIGFCTKIKKTGGESQGSAWSSLSHNATNACTGPKQGTPTCWDKCKGSGPKRVTVNSLIISSKMIEWLRHILVNYNFYE